MKKSRLLLSIGMLAFAGIATTFTSCSSDDPVCPTGMEGKNCDEEIRTKFLGSYVASDSEVGGSALPSYTATITKGTTISEVKIGNFSNGYFDNDVIAGTISGNAISIENQEPDSDDFFVSGSGTISGDIITISYTITSDEGEQIKYTGSWEK